VSPRRDQRSGSALQNLNLNIEARNAKQYQRRKIPMTETTKLLKVAMRTSVYLGLWNIRMSDLFRPALVRVALQHTVPSFIDQKALLGIQSVPDQVWARDFRLRISSLSSYPELLTGRGCEDRINRVGALIAIVTPSPSRSWHRVPKVWSQSPRIPGRDDRLGRLR
jgi:hypothetical protein